MKICRVTGNGVCINCNKTNALNKYGDEICRKDAEKCLDVFVQLLGSQLTDEQKDILCDSYYEDEQ